VSHDDHAEQVGVANGLATLGAGATHPAAQYTEMVGDSGAGGTKGAVPAPAAGDAAAGKFLKADGTWAAAGSGPRTDYGALAADPGGTPSDGDIYYNTALDMEMRYDAGRTKWLSIESQVFQFGRSGNTADGAYYKHVDAMTMSATAGFMVPHNGTLIGVGYTRTDTDAATFEIQDDGVSLGTLASAAVAGSVMALNGDFAASSVLSALNQTGSATTSGVLGWFKVKWRA